MNHPAWPSTQQLEPRGNATHSAHVLACIERMDASALDLLLTTLPETDRTSRDCLYAVAQVPDHATQRRLVTWVRIQFTGIGRVCQKVSSFKQPDWVPAALRPKGYSVKALAPREISLNLQPVCSFLRETGTTVGNWCNAELTDYIDRNTEADGGGRFNDFTVNHLVRQVRHFLEETGSRKEADDRAPSALIRKVVQGARDWTPYADVQALRAQTAHKSADLRDLSFAILLSGGVPPEDALALTGWDLRFTPDGYVVVKLGSRGWFCLAVPWQHLAELKRRMVVKGDNGPLFKHSLQGKGATATTMDAVLRRLGKRLGIKLNKSKLVAFGHAELLALGVTMHYVRELAGHSSNISMDKLHARVKSRREKDSTCLPSPKSVARATSQAYTICGTCGQGYSNRLAACPGCNGDKEAPRTQAERLYVELVSMHQRLMASLETTNAQRAEFLNRLPEHP